MHRGVPLEAHLRRAQYSLLADALKVTYVAAQLGSGRRKGICVAGEQAAQPFRVGSWLGGVLRDMSVDVVVVQPDPPGT